MGIREDFSYGASAAGAAAFGVLGWFLNSPLLGVVAGVLLGTGLTLLTQSKTQKRIWKRELGLKNIDTIYGPLYREITANLAKGAPSAKTSFQLLNTAEWQRIKSDYLYHFVPDQLKDVLEHHYKLVEKYNSLIGRVLTKVGQAIVNEASVFFDRPLQGIMYAATPSAGSALPMTIDTAVMFGEHPRDYLRTIYSELGPLKFSVMLTRREPTRGVTETLEAPADLKRFDEFFEAACKKVRELDVIVEIHRTLGEINFGGQDVQERTLRQIREPWSM